MYNRAWQAPIFHSSWLYNGKLAIVTKGNYRENFWVVFWHITSSHQWFRKIGQYGLRERMVRMFTYPPKGDSHTPLLILIYTPPVPFLRFPLGGVEKILTILTRLA
jgi:hypothetical protein